MAQRYDDWDKKRYKTAKSIPWWMRNIRTVQYIGWSGCFLWAFGSIYRMLLLPSQDQKSRVLDPKYDKDLEIVRKNMEQREKKLIEKALSDKKPFERSDFPSDSHGSTV